MNACQSLADALLGAGVDACKASEDKRNAIEMGMAQQRLAQCETRFQWVGGPTMLADVLTKGKERGHVDLLRQLMGTCRYRVRPTSVMLEARKYAPECSHMGHDGSNAQVWGCEDAA